jgi:hypothetical protein
MSDLLKEELRRMQTLMVYTNGDYNNPILKEQEGIKSNDGMGKGPRYNSKKIDIKFGGGKYDIEAAGGLSQIEQEANNIKKWIKENPNLINAKIQINVNAGSSYYWRKYRKHTDALKKSDDTTKNETLTKNRANAGVEALRKFFPKDKWGQIVISPVENANIGKYWGDVRKEAIDKAKADGKTGNQLNVAIAEAWKKWIAENKKNQYVSISAGISSDNPEPKKCICKDEKTGEEKEVGRDKDGNCLPCPDPGGGDEGCKPCPDGTIPKKDENGDCEECPKEDPEPEPIKEEIEKCFKRNSKFTIEYGKDQLKHDHQCSKAVWEVYANGIKLKRKTKNGKTVDYVSLNNTLRLADDATQSDGKYAGLRVNVVDINAIDLNEFSNLDSLKKYKGNLQISLKCLSGTGKWPAHGSTNGCHKDVAGIRYRIDGKDYQTEVPPPYNAGEQKVIFEIPACVKTYKELVESGKLKT